MNSLNPLIELFKEAFDGLYAVNVEGQSHEPDTAFTDEQMQALCVLARDALRRYRVPPELTMRIRTDGGECVELRMTLDYRKEVAR